MNINKFLFLLLLMFIYNVVRNWNKATPANNRNEKKNTKPKKYEKNDFKRIAFNSYVNSTNEL